MPTIPFATFVGPSYVSQSPIADAERCINWYVERMESEGAIVPTALYPTAGITVLGSVPQTGGRAAYSIIDRLFVVVGNGLYEIDGGWGNSLLGTLAVDQYPATLTSNGAGGQQVFITSGTVGSLYNLSTGVFTASVVTNVTMGGMVDGFFLALDSPTGTLKVSDSLAGLTWDPTQVALRSAAADPWIAMCINNRQICLWGAQSGEFWYDAGTSPFPFALASGSNFGIGTAAIFSGVSLNGVIYWLGQSSDGARRVYKLQGYTPVPISTHAVEYAFAQYSRVDDAEGFAFELFGHLNYRLNFPSANATWEYDATENLWHEGGDWNNALNRFDVDRPQSHAYAFNKHIVVDRLTGSFGELTAASGTNFDGVPIRRVRVSPALVKNLERINVGLFELMLEPGLGLQSGQGSNPQVMLRVSRNGAKTWGSERMRSAGAVGQYGKRVRWLKCGSGRDMVFEISVSDAIPWRILTAFLGLARMEAAA